MSDRGLPARLRAHRITLIAAAIGVAACSVPPADDRGARHGPGIADERSRATIYDCELRPGAEAVVKPGAEPRDALRMSGCEMIFWDADKSPPRDPNAETGR